MAGSPSSSSRFSFIPALPVLWRQRGLIPCLLWPLSRLFAALASVRRAAYRLGCCRSAHLPVAVVVVGNITAGGAGKTPVTLHLAQQLLAAGRQPGIVSRGYGRSVANHEQAASFVQEVALGSLATDVGDEPLLLRERSGCPVFVGRQRADAARALLAAYPEVDVILCDDGLQHYGLARDVEIAVIDRRGVMNGWRLPAGPLREPISRLREVDALVLNGLTETAPAFAPLRGLNAALPRFAMRLQGRYFYRLDAPDVQVGADELRTLKLDALAGIGEPERFFDQLRDMGLVITPHAFPDHHVYVCADFQAEELSASRFLGDALLITEKDAVKLRSLLAKLSATQDNPCPLPLVLPPVWVLPVTAEIPGLAQLVLEKIDGRTFA